MRRVAILLSIGFCTACGAHATGPAWPKSAGVERVGEAKDDGGESLAPRVPTAAVAVEGPAVEDNVAPVAAAAPAAKPAAPADGAAPAAPTATDPNAPIILDFEETIEIDAK
jgi:hypothetical protein